MKSVKEIKTDLSFVKDYEVVVFGSYAGKRADKRSDIDIAMITREKDRDKCMKIWMEVLGKAPDIYDIKIFELLPLHIKASLIDNYEVVFGNRLDISEYFYEFRKLWNDTVPERDGKSYGAGKVQVLAEGKDGSEGVNFLRMAT